MVPDRTFLRKASRFVWPLLGLFLMAALTTAVVAKELPAPSGAVAAATSLTFTPNADAYVDESNASRNYGTGSKLYTDSSPDQYSYLRFAVSGLTASVESATLRLYVTNGTKNGPAVYATSNSWSETGITWSNKPSRSGGASDDIGEAVTNSWVEFDVTSLVTGNGTFSFVLVPTAVDGMDFYSRTGSRPPQLVVTTGVSQPPSTPVPPTSTPVPAPTGTPSPAPTAVPTVQPTAQPTPPPSSACTVTVPTSASTIDGAGNYSSIGPGDTICIQAGSRSSLTIRNIKGDAGNPVTIRNSGGVVTVSSGILVRSSEHIRITGTGVSSNCGADFEPADQKCGFKISNSGGKGIDGRYGSTYVEIDHVEISNTGSSGIQFKSLPSEGYSFSFTQHGPYVRDNYIHDTSTEGMYLGSSYYSDRTEPVLSDVAVSNNYVADTGWDGIQVGSAISQCRIDHNRIFRDSKAVQASQMSGVMVNRGSVCDVYNNYIKDGTAAYGIFLQGNGGNKVYNNVVLDRKQNNGKGIHVSTGSNTGNSISIWNNTVANIQQSGISFSNTAGSANKIQNNIVAGAGSTAISAGIAASSNNLTTSDVTSVGFVDPASGDYSLKQGSKAIDAGAQVPVNFDMNDAPRPKGSGFDQGSYEY